MTLILSDGGFSLDPRRVKQFDRVTARFLPVDRETLRDGLQKWIGREFVWEAKFLIEEGQHAGHWAMMPVERMVDGEVPLDGYWVPLCDLNVSKV